MNKFSASQAGSTGSARPMNYGNPANQAADGDASSSSELGEPRQRVPGGQPTQDQLGASSESAAPVLPPVDIFEDDDGVTIMADLPGVSKDHLGVRIEGDSLVIEGTASPPETGNMALLYGEVLSPFYRRSFTLSRDLDPGKIEASLNSGVLKLKILKAESARPRRIEVRVG